jgi:hypothetical protein
MPQPDPGVPCCNKSPQLSAAGFSVLNAIGGHDDNGDNGGGVDNAGGAATRSLPQPVHLPAAVRKCPQTQKA